MKGKAAYKAEGLKLVRVSLEHDGGKIKGIRLTGDFFLHPESGIEEIEKALVGKKIEEGLVNAIDAVVKKNGIEMYGLNSKAICDAIEIAAGAGK